MSDRLCNMCGRNRAVPHSVQSHCVFCHKIVKMLPIFLNLGGMKAQTFVEWTLQDHRKTS